MRINRYLAQQGIATRREADNLIKAGKVKINNQLAKLGDQVSETDKVEVVNRAPKTYKYFAYHKPVGVTTPEKDTKGLFPLGRLDKESRGLIILTNDGRLTDRLLNPNYDHEKEYLVTVDKPIKQTNINALTRGINIEGYKTKPAKVELEETDQFRITLTEGKKHQIRRMCAALGFAVLDLWRGRIGSITIEGLKENQTRPIVGSELANFLSETGLTN